MYKLFIFEEGVELGSETVAAEDLDATKEYYSRQGYQLEVEKLS